MSEFIVGFSAMFNTEVLGAFAGVFAMGLVVVILVSSVALFLTVVYIYLDHKFGNKLRRWVD